MNIKWISVKDKLPEQDVRVLVVTDNNEVGIGCRTKLLYLKTKDNVRWVATEPIADYHEIIFWMPMPKSPKSKP